MSSVPQYYFQDIPAEVMAEIADAMQKNDWVEFSLDECEGRNHQEHRGGLWQCDECLRIFCWEESADDSACDLCLDCWARLHAPRKVVAFA